MFFVYVRTATLCRHLSLRSEGGFFFMIWVHFDFDNDFDHDEDSVGPPSFRGLTFDSFVMLCLGECLFVCLCVCLLLQMPDV